MQRALRALGRFPIPRLRGLYRTFPAFLEQSPREFIVDFFGLKYRGDLSEFVDRQIFYFGSYSPLELRS